MPTPRQQRQKVAAGSRAAAAAAEAAAGVGRQQSSPLALDHAVHPAAPLALDHAVHPYQAHEQQRSFCARPAEQALWAASSLLLSVDVKKVSCIMHKRV